jgi:hypothetical protein
MAIEDDLRTIAERIQSHSSAILTEEAVKTAVVLPFLAALGYDVFNPHEVIPEFTADAVGKKGEKVDYGVKVGDRIRILIECKGIGVTLEKAHLAQLYRYFSVTSAKFAMLTNGRTFNFYTDLDEPNKLDSIPFLVFDLADMQGPLVAELKKFAKKEFDFDGIRQSASRLKYISTIKRRIGELFDNPTEDVIRTLSGGLYEGRFTQVVLDQFTPLTKAAYRELIREAVQLRLSSALANTAPMDEATVDAATGEPEIETTAEEIEGFMIVRAIVCEVIKPARVVIRDQQSYCAILVDDNNRKPLARLHFNRSVKYVGLFDKNREEERVKIESPDQIYTLAERLRSTAKMYPEGQKAPAAIKTTSPDVPQIAESAHPDHVE